MHSAPAVSYPVGRSRFYGWLVVLTGLAGLLIGLLWRFQADLAGWRHWLFFMSLMGSFCIAAETWRRASTGTLRWDGATWSWTNANLSACGVLSIHIDVQFCLLLSLRIDRCARIWLWPERRADVTRWNALRRAVFSGNGEGRAQTANAVAARAQVRP